MQAIAELRTEPSASSEVPLTTACARLGWGYQKGWNAVLRGQLEGRRDARGRILVSAAALERVASDGGHR